MRKLACAIALLSAFFFEGCQSLPLDAGSAFAATSGQRTLILGATDQGFHIGWANVAITKGAPLPHLSMFFLNPASYAVSDCEFNIKFTGNTPAGNVDLDLSDLAPELARDGFCLLKVEAVEHWSDGNNQHPIPLMGGFFIEAYEPGYLPTPPTNLIAFCYKFGRTTKGRTIMEQCTP